MPDGLYERDILIWSEQQADLLRRLAAGERLNADVDWTNVIEEVEDVGRSRLAACESLLLQAITHLLKLQAYPTHDSARHWRRETIVFLARAKRYYAPSMRGRIELQALHEDAFDAAIASFPEVAIWHREECPFTFDELIFRAGLVHELLEDRDI